MVMRSFESVNEETLFHLVSGSITIGILYKKIWQKIRYGEIFLVIGISNILSENMVETLIPKIL